MPTLNLNRRAVLFTLVLSFLPNVAGAASPTYICKKTATGAIAIRVSKCRRGETKLSNISQLQGANGADGVDGANGSNGADGSLRIYGDASSGPLTVSSSANLSTLNTQFTDITVDNGATLLVPSGTVLRCTGSFTNNGTILVGNYAIGAFIGTSAATAGTTTQLAPASAGISPSIASQGAFGTSAGILAGGTSGIGMATFFSLTGYTVLHPGPNGGGGGGAGFAGGGGGGGGTLSVLCAGAVTNNGTISAAGGDSTFFNGSGGGGGGIVILASKTSAANSATGTIDVSGGDGGPSAANTGAGGGGGGGVIVLMAPTTPTNAGTFTVSGGAAGANTAAVTSSPRVGGAGGGSCYGAGGGGSQVTTGNVSSGSAAGQVGQSYLTTADPTSLF